MCTVTVVPHASGVRVMCNRDERRDRPAAWPPSTERLGGRTAAFPTDPVGGGSWIGINDVGLVVALLNRSREETGAGVETPRPPGDQPIRPLRSRGSIVPVALGASSAAAAADACAGLDPTSYAPFEVVVTDGRLLVTVASDGRSTQTAVAALEAARLFTSSALGDALVEAPRRALFERMVVRGARGPLDGQRRFHRHQWRLRPHVSVLMSRADAATVSRTRVDLSDTRSVLVYDPLDGSAPRTVTCSRSR